VPFYISLRSLVSLLRYRQLPVTAVLRLALNNSYMVRLWFIIYYYTKTWRLSL